MAVSISRYDYAGMYGPTTGDKLRLADTEIFVEVEFDVYYNNCFFFPDHSTQIIQLK